jgi:hypothetical protein
MLMKDTHLTKVIIERPYNVVWKIISDPINYPQIYPFWLSKVKKVDSNSYEGKGPHGKYKFTKIIEHDFGIVDLKLGEESSRTRLFSLDDESTVVIHLGVRWKDMKNPLAWFFYKRGVDKDFKNAKKVIEKL